MPQDQQPNRIDATIADLEAWQERIGAAIATLKSLRSLGGMLPDVGSPLGTKANATEIGHDTFFQMTVMDAAEKYLALAKMTKPTADIASSLLKGGLKTASKDFTGMVKVTLSRDNRFVRVNREWGLAVWYPALRRGRAATGGDASDIKVEAKQESRSGESTADAKTA